MLGLRGPHGSQWPLERAVGRDVVIVAGGLGFAPLRLAIRSLLNRRPEHGWVVLIYGARQPADLLFAAEYPEWVIGMAMTLPYSPLAGLLGFGPLPFGSSSR